MDPHGVAPDPLRATLSPVDPGDAVRLSALDEARFGIRTARAPALTITALSSVLSFCRSSRVRLLIAQSHCMDLHMMHAAQRAGLVLMDTQMCWVADLRHTRLDEGRSAQCIRSAGPGEAEQVRQVALRAFRGYLGHYHADPRLDDSTCNEVYGDWAYRSCMPDSADHVLVAEHEGKIVGFTSVRLRTPDEGEAVLAGVDPAYRSRGFYSALNIGRALWCRANGATWMFSTTLATNVLTQRAYLKAGLLHSYGSYTFHKWFDDEDEHGSFGWPGLDERPGS